jgi:ribosomal protein L37AE/L43A
VLNTSIITCPKCPPHPFQDGRYGQNRRVANRVKQTTEQTRHWRCTACGTAVDTGSAEPIVIETQSGKPKEK